MAIDSDSLTEVLQLAQTCEDLSRAALGVAQNLLRAKLIAQDVFDQVFGDYGVAMQKARDLYYQASHTLAQQIAQSRDVKTLIARTQSLNQSLARLQKTEHVLTISFGVVALVAAITTAVITPGSATLEGAFTAARTLEGAIVS